MPRMILYVFYLSAPYIIVHNSFFYPHFDLKRFLLFSAMLMAARSLAADAKDAFGADQICKEIGKLDVDFVRLKLATPLLEGGDRKAVARLAEIVTTSTHPNLLLLNLVPLLMLLKKAEQVLILSVSAIKGNYFHTYACFANRRLAVILVPDDAETVASDPWRKFAILHEVGHCHPSNIAVFERQKYETIFFTFIMLLVILAHASEPFWKQLLVLIPICLLAALINRVLLLVGRVGAEVHADNIATKLAYVLDRPLFDGLETIQLPKDVALNSIQEKVRRNSFILTLRTYRNTTLLDTRQDLTLPPFGFYLLYGPLVYLAGWMIDWGRSFDDKFFEPWWILAGGAVLMKMAVYWFNNNVRRGVMKKVTGAEEFLFGLERTPDLAAREGPASARTVQSA
jgi:hypothetical protein